MASNSTSQPPPHTPPRKAFAGSDAIVDRVDASIDAELLALSELEAELTICADEVEAASNALARAQSQQQQQMQMVQGGGAPFSPRQIGLFDRDGSSGALTLTACSVSFDGWAE